MRAMLIAAAALSLCVGSAYARDDEGRVAVAANSQSTDTPGEIAQASAQNAEKRTRPSYDSAGQAGDPALRDQSEPGHVAVRAQPE